MVLSYILLIINNNQIYINNNNNNNNYNYNDNNTKTRTVSDCTILIKNIYAVNSTLNGQMISTQSVALL